MASADGLPAVAAAMEVNSLGAEAPAVFWEAAQPAVTALINARFGEAGTAMLEQMLAAAEE